MMCLNDSKTQTSYDSDRDSISSGEELPIWVRGEQRWVSGITEETTCQDVIQVLLQDEDRRGRPISYSQQFQITERWRGVEQPLDELSKILDIWNAWGTAQTEVKISLRRVKPEAMRPSSRRARCRSDSSTWSDRSAFKTIHPKRLQALQNERQPSSTEELLKLVLAQGEVIRRQLKKLRHSEHQIGYLEDKTHRARVRKHGSNYLLETYLKGLSEAVDPEQDTFIADKNSDSGVMTEGDSEQSNTNKQTRNGETLSERFSPYSEESIKDTKDDDSSSTVSEATIKEQVGLFEKINKLNKRLLKEEENLVRLEANLKKYQKNEKNKEEDVSETLTKLRMDMIKSSCEMQHNEIVLEETLEKLETRRVFLENLHRELVNEDQEHEMLQALLFTKMQQFDLEKRKSKTQYVYQTKELLDTLV
ncbi:ras association domain-containing protein 10-like isoform X2 [Diabrotica virgifera virgifera]|uniref:Ras association domain-containing protein n=2 Tax=Diabrotica virgifera virgifera TaxID=50390 RepID=A0ABM5K7F6_DIAVI|nr:ras association domain-containing protein 10-like isoform X2 [Diabrotica virgifera virgifera]XP_050506123.1 ras association domain-containing protein 10-like isoform X2 [Diabrotica virgifera virgifera]XP_050506124.1 ras association domain-containing protein 10-like isoform X2 [Diabrotica virgifera virgifera]XP_050506125.1 ras association domain-containing protein 10-like isoform X2 [Diabrotica virgifera virgifera]XP_050506126.1 ras association domain-containing protein 10-like isoform X2 [Di